MQPFAGKACELFYDEHAARSPKMGMPFLQPHIMDRLAMWLTVRRLLTSSVVDVLNIIRIVCPRKYASNAIVCSEQHKY